jgi:hypothetical protein
MEHAGAVPSRFISIAPGSVGPPMAMTSGRTGGLWTMVISSLGFASPLFFSGAGFQRVASRSWKGGDCRARLAQSGVFLPLTVGCQICGGLMVLLGFEPVMTALLEPQ